MSIGTPPNQSQLFNTSLKPSHTVVITKKIACITDDDNLDKIIIQVTHPTDTWCTSLRQQTVQARITAYFLCLLQYDVIRSGMIKHIMHYKLYHQVFK